MVTVASQGVLLAASAFAQEEGEAGVVYRKKTVISFDDDTIDGDLTKPDGTLVETRIGGRHSNLIKVRENFRDRILDSISKI